MTFETFDLRDEETWPDHQKDNDKDNFNDKDKENDKDTDRINETLLVCYIFEILMSIPSMMVDTKCDKSDKYD